MPEESTPTAKKPEGKPKSEKTPVFRLLAALLLPFMYFVARYEVEGEENLPKHGAFILSPNHYSEIDPVVVGVFVWRLGRAPRYLAKASLFKVPVLGWLLRKSGQVPVQRTGVVRGSDPLAAANKLAHEGLAVIIYPEGSLTRDPDLWPMRGKSGAVRMALEAGVPLIPMAQWGTQAVLPRYGKRISLFPRKTIRARIGTPVDLSAFAGRKLDSATLNEATALLMTHIAALLSDLRGEPAPAVLWDPSQHNQSEIGRF
ncbi:MAG: lysophospholipid acyltransferase family protein [Lacisediminihabitans sp.]